MISSFSSLVFAFFLFLKGIYFHLPNPEGGGGMTLYKIKKIRIEKKVLAGRKREKRFHLEVINWVEVPFKYWWIGNNFS